MKKLIISIFFYLSLTACATQNNLSSLNEQKLAQIYLDMGLVYLKQGQLPQAKTKLLAALAINPKSIAVLDAMGYYWEIIGNSILAESYYQKAINLDPKSGRALNNYGVFLCRQKQYNKAAPYLLSAAKDPNYADSAAAMENAGLCAMAANQPQQAKVYFEQALKQDPNRKISAYELTQLSKS